MRFDKVYYEQFAHACDIHLPVSATPPPVSPTLSACFDAYLLQPIDYSNFLHITGAALPPRTLPGVSIDLPIIISAYAPEKFCYFYTSFSPMPHDESSGEKVYLLSHTRISSFAVIGRTCRFHYLFLHTVLMISTIRAVRRAIFTELIRGEPPHALAI